MPTFDTTILGGLPVTVAFTIDGPDPDVGIFGYGVNDWNITHVNQRPIKNANWIYKRLEATPKEEERLLDKLNDYASNDHNFEFED